MSDALLPLGDGHTALDEDDRHGLIPTWIATRGDLFDAEQRNITTALLGRRPSTSQLLDDKYLRDLHRAMFGEVWRWAGKYRRTQTNLGLTPAHIPAAVRTLVDDAVAWVDHRTYEPDELAVRFHHRLVAIHPFPNGNGRHGRIAADCLITSLRLAPFQWGAGLDLDTAQLRDRYLQALRNADQGDHTQLVEFARS